MSVISGHSFVISPQNPPSMSGRRSSGAGASPSRAAPQDVFPGEAIIGLVGLGTRRPHPQSPAPILRARIRWAPARAPPATLAPLLPAFVFVRPAGRCLRGGPDCGTRACPRSGHSPCRILVPTRPVPSRPLRVPPRATVRMYNAAVPGTPPSVWDCVAEGVRFQFGVPFATGDKCRAKWLSLRDSAHSGAPCKLGLSVEALDRLMADVLEIAPVPPTRSVRLRVRPSAAAALYVCACPLSCVCVRVR